MAQLLISCAGDDAGTQRTSGEKDPATKVRVETLGRSEFTESFEAVGIVKASDDILIPSEEGGVLRKWLASKGDIVEKNTTIALLSDDVLKPGYESALAQYNSAELTYQKQKAVYKEKAISQWQLMTAQYNRDAAKAQADLMKARFERTVVKSPVNGILDERFLDEGELASPGMPIARVVNIANVRILASIPEHLAGSIARGTEGSFTVAAYPGRVFTGKITFVGSALSPDNRTFPVELEVRNPGKLLKPEMIVRLKIQQSASRQALLVKQELIRLIDRNTYVIFVADKGLAKQKTVTIGARSGNLVEVVSGLSDGDLLIAVGFQNLVDGQPIDIIDAMEPASR